ncbi:MAG TPA: peptidoglycan editing factor PgeF [Ktedonobacteraceae bacterium]|nr:peptidoglycan editing factor PgeF [Ktedonobacteraceae bacterium]
MIEQQRGSVRYLQFSQLMPFSEIVHGVFTRLGGYSAEPYKGLNVSSGVGDDPESAIRNRLLVLETLGLENKACATLWQVHGADVAILDPDNETWDDWRTDWPYRSYSVDGRELTWTFKARRKADAIFTRQRGVPLVLSFADCVPIVLYDPVRHVIGIAHGGWRGTARGIALAAIETMRSRFDSQPGDIRASLAPSIGSCCYEVSEDVRALFLGQETFPDVSTDERYRAAVRESAVFSMKQRANRPTPTLHLDLWETNYSQLLMAGLLPEHIELSGLCTGCRTDLFFSHRAERGKTGRFPVVVTLKDEGKEN